MVVLGVLRIKGAAFGPSMNGVTPELYVGVSAAVLMLGAVLCAVMGWRRAHALLERAYGDEGVPVT